MGTPNRYPAFFAYGLPLVGCLYVFLLRREDEFALYHAKQAAVILLTALVTPIIWGGVAWLLSWLPFGFLLGVALFTLVIAAYLFLVGLWLLGMLYVSQSQTKPLPLIGQWAKWIPID
jgi:uncharacterized membrane protein